VGAFDDLNMPKQGRARSSLRSGPYIYWVGDCGAWVT